MNLYLILEQMDIFHSTSTFVCKVLFYFAISLSFDWKIELLNTLIPTCFIIILSELVMLKKSFKKVIYQIWVSIRQPIVIFVKFLFIFTVVISRIKIDLVLIVLITKIYLRRDHLCLIFTNLLTTLELLHYDLIHFQHFSCPITLRIIVAVFTSIFYERN